MSNTRIVYFGTPEFAASQLKALIEAQYNVVAVVTMPDKPAGRGKKIQSSEVKKTALEYGLPVLQPERLRDESFIDTLRSYHADLFVVVAFRMLPEAVWAMPPMGTFNLHASLLPQYRGAAPINFAIINGEKTTGLTTFFLNHEIDKGDIIMRESLFIGADETFGELHDRLMLLGNKVIIETIQKIERNEASTIKQDNLNDEELHTAPKLTKEFCEIDWNKSGAYIHNLIRGLSPYPAARTTLLAENGDELNLKIYSGEFEPSQEAETPGKVVSDGKKHLKITTIDGFIDIKRLQQAGKNQMTTEEFLRGQHTENKWITAKMQA